MKIIAMFAAGALAAGTLVSATPAEAQRGWDGYRGGGWNGNRGWRGDRGWRGHRGWRGDRGWRGGNRWRGPRYAWNGGWNGPRWGYGRPRVVCRIVPSYWGPVRRCF